MGFAEQPHSAREAPHGVGTVTGVGGGLSMNPKVTVIETFSRSFYNRDRRASAEGALEQDT